MSLQAEKTNEKILGKIIWRTIAMVAFVFTYIHLKQVEGILQEQKNSQHDLKASVLLEVNMNARRLEELEIATDRLYVDFNAIKQALLP